MPVEIEETLTRIAVLLRIIAENEGISISELARKSGLNYVTVRRLVDALANLGWVEKRVGGLPRTASLRLTDRGRCLLECMK